MVPRVFCLYLIWLIMGQLKQENSFKMKSYFQELGKKSNVSVDPEKKEY